MRLPRKFVLTVWAFIFLFFVFPIAFSIILSASYSHYLWIRVAKMAKERQPVSRFERAFGPRKTRHEGDERQLSWSRSSIEKSFGISISDRQRVVNFWHEGLPYFTVLLVYDIDSGETVWVKIL